MIEPLPYHREILAYLKREEGDLWEWYSSKKFLVEHADNVRLELLKSTYRLDRAAHGPLYGQADQVLKRLGLTAPITLYQSQVERELNVSLSFLPDEAHVVLSGPVLSTLSPPEIDWVLGHELSHHLLLQGWGGEYLIADQVLSAMASHPQAEPSQIQSCRFFQLYSEIYADRGAHDLFQDALLGIGALVRLGTGLREVSPAAYLAQAREIIARGKIQSAGITHPEQFIRAFALDRWAREPAATDAEIRRLIEGALPLDELDLAAQRRISDLTRRVIGRFAAMAGADSEAILGLARLYFGDFSPGGSEPFSPSETDALDASVQDYLSYVLLDFAAVDRDLDDLAVAAAVVIAREMGIEERFAGAAAKELKIKKRDLEKVRAEAPQILQRAGKP